MNIRDVMKRGELLADESYRRQFRKDLAKKYGPRVWHRDLYDAQIPGSNAAQQLLKCGQVENVAQALAIGLEQDREVGVTGCDLEQVVAALPLLPEGSPLARPAAR